MTNAAYWSERLARLTACPFARLTRVICVNVDEITGLRQGAEAVAAFSRRLPTPNDRMLAVVCTTTVHEPTTEGLASLFHTMVYRANVTPEAKAALYRGITSRAWRLRINGLEAFALVLSPVYPPDHQRHFPERTVVLIQPEALFSHHGITSGERRHALSAVVAKSFWQAGIRAYRYDHSVGLPKAYRIVQPTNGSQGVRWWDTPLLL